MTGPATGIAKDAIDATLSIVVVHCLASASEDISAYATRMPEPLPNELEGVPEEMRQKIYEYLPPGTLQSLRETSAQFQASVDGYVESIVRNGELVDSENKEVGKQPNPPSAPDALQAWANGVYGTQSFPVEDAPPLTDPQLLELYDGAFTTYNMASWQPTMMTDVYDPLIAAGGDNGFRVEVELRGYARAKLLAGEVVDADRDPVPASTTANATLAGIRAGTMRFQPG
jgi:hypothetical protein